MISKGEDAHLAYIFDSNMVREDIGKVPVVNEFPEVFLEELSRILPNKDVEFSIDVTSGTAPISSAPCTMAPVELKELKAKL